MAPDELHRGREEALEGMCLIVDYSFSFVLLYLELDLFLG